MNYREKCLYTVILPQLSLPFMIIIHFYHHHYLNRSIYYDFWL